MKHPSLDDTIEYVVGQHYGQRDKAGAPYVAHLFAVMRRVSPRLWHVALLHDTMEDTGVTKEQLLECGYETWEVEVVSLLTRNMGKLYDAYINDLLASENADAIEVKIADLEDNMDLARLKEVTEKDLLRNAKYKDAWLRLRKWWSFRLSNS